jgi:hypothetical protein
MSDIQNFNDFNNVTAPAEAGTNIAGIILSDTFENWREKTNGIIAQTNTNKTNIESNDVDIATINANAAFLNATDFQKFDKTTGSTVTSVTNPSSLDLKVGNTFIITLTQNCDLSSGVTNIASTGGGIWNIVIINQGGFQITWPSAFKFAHGTGQLTTTDDSSNPTYNYLSLANDGTNLYAFLSSDINTLIDEKTAGAATMHFLNIYDSGGATANNSNPSQSMIDHAKATLGDTVKDGHFVLLRYKQSYDRWNGNSTSYLTRQGLIVYRVTGTYTGNAGDDPTYGQNWSMNTNAMVPHNAGNW